MYSQGDSLIPLYSYRQFVHQSNCFNCRHLALCYLKVQAVRMWYFPVCALNCNQRFSSHPPTPERGCLSRPHASRPGQSAGGSLGGTDAGGWGLPANSALHPPRLHCPTCQQARSLEGRNACYQFGSTQLLGE